jgi:hypothetical protein
MAVADDKQSSVQRNIAETVSNIKYELFVHKRKY